MLPFLVEQGPIIPFKTRNKLRFFKSVKDAFFTSVKKKFSSLVNLTTENVQLNKKQTQSDVSLGFLG